MKKTTGGGLLLLAIGIGFLGPLGCSASTAGFVAGVGQAAARSSSNVSATKLMVFGGDNHKTYLGCLSCSEYAADSVFNEYGPSGSRYSQTSILNPYSPYGSPYSQHSACNPHASDPPVIVDQDGKFFGRLTVNAYHPQATSMSNMKDWLAGVCAR